LGFVVARWVGSPGDPPGNVLAAIGEEQGRALREQLGYGADPRECARAVTLANRLFAIRASVQAPAVDVARVTTPGCPWSRKDWWSIPACSAFSRYEMGLVNGLNPRVSLRYECKRTRGDARCVGLYTWADRP